MIGVYGGTFDPVHYGHLRTALEVSEIFGLDAVHLIPCATPPHRKTPHAAAKMRAAMLQLAVANHPKLLVDSRELQRTGPSYMVDTLKSLQQDLPTQTLLLFIGTDAFNQLTGWHQWQDLFRYAHVVVITRPSYQQQILAEFFSLRLTTDINDLAHSQAGKLLFQPVTQLDISATAIRDMIAKHRNPGFLLPDAVIDYIKHHRLYTPLN
jgi:nicotinate-nucleotide adenylyltransferase